MYRYYFFEVECTINDFGGGTITKNSGLVHGWFWQINPSKACKFLKRAYRTKDGKFEYDRVRITSLQRIK